MNLTNYINTHVFKVQGIYIDFILFLAIIFLFPSLKSWLS